MIEKWSLKEIIEHARTHSPYYRELYKQTTSCELKDLPLIDQNDFWKGQLLTAAPEGIVFKSGGSTGAPKFSYFTSREWQSFTSVFGEGIAKGILEDGDRVANLFYVGDLYASFLFIKDSLQSIPSHKKSILHFPIGGATNGEQILKTLEEFSINVLAGVPSALLTLLTNYQRETEKYPKIKIEKILFGGEALYPDQVSAFKAIFPDIKISSVGCASVDGGLIGFSDAKCENFEHRSFDGATIVEIVDPDTLEVIQEMNRTGKVLITNLTRKLMPIVRYPSGDMAMWMEPEGAPERKFKLMGRSDEAARLGTISVYFEDTREMVMKALSFVQGIQFQMHLSHYDHKDELTLKLAAPGLASSKETIDQLISAFKKDKPVYEEVLKKGLIHPLKVEIVAMKDLEANARTGKLKRVIDRRS